MMPELHSARFPIIETGKSRFSWKSQTFFSFREFRNVSHSNRLDWEIQIRSKTGCFRVEQTIRTTNYNFPSLLLLVQLNLELRGCKLAVREKQIRSQQRRQFSCLIRFGAVRKLIHFNAQFNRLKWKFGSRVCETILSANKWGTCWLLLNSLIRFFSLRQWIWRKSHAKDWFVKRLENREWNVSKVRWINFYLNAGKSRLPKVKNLKHDRVIHFRNYNPRLLYLNGI